MGEQTTLVAEKREDSGSQACRRMRREGWLPGVVSMVDGPGRNVRISAHEFGLMLHHHASESLILNLKIADGEAKKVLLKEVQHDPITDEPIHVDFVEISMTRKMKVDIPIVVVGEPVGVTEQGGILDHLLHQLEIECLPGDLKETAEIDVSGLRMGDALYVRNIDLGPAIAVLTDPNIAVARVSEPVAEEAEEAPAAAVAGEEGAPAAEGEAGAEGKAGEKSAEKAGDKEEKGRKS